MKIKLYDLPKVSTNKFYSSMHWTKRKALKDNYTLIIHNQFKDILPKTKKYEVEYLFNFRVRPLDASNCSIMLKMIEDVIFENDKHNIVESIKIRSRKNKEEFVEITITEI